MTAAPTTTVHLTQEELEDLIDATFAVPTITYAAPANAELPILTARRKLSEARDQLEEIDRLKGMTRS